jgi:amino acid transporter
MNDTAELVAADSDSADDGAGDADEASNGLGLGTFAGVYRPTVLTILGVMMYLREGWLVGQAGLGGAVLVILATFLITGCTAMSLSTITTNIRLGGGGAFAVISQSLGLEAGGSIGIPLYLAQSLSAALYMYGFAETWVYLFGHPMWAAILGVFVVTFAITLVSTKLAFKLQGVVMLVVLASLVSIALGLTKWGPADHLHNPQLWGEFEAGNFWMLFAIFFPAGTGIMVGASMSGRLEDARSSIPKGTLAAVGTALVVYLFFALWYSLLATPEALRENTLIVTELAWSKEIVFAGILASTFTATLSSMVAAPNVLSALGKYGVTPKGDVVSKLTESGEARNATLVTGILIAGALSLGSLNRVASLITMFFLLTYFTINVVVLVEQQLGMVSFRPLFKIPRFVPLIGTVSCAVAVFVISPTFGLVAITFVVGVYAYLVRRHLEQPWETVRSGMFVSLADWAAKRIARSKESNERSWKPDLLVPVQSRAELDGQFRFLRAMTFPKGSLHIVGIKARGEDRLLDEHEHTEDEKDGEEADADEPMTVETVPEQGESTGLILPRSDAEDAEQRDEEKKEKKKRRTSTLMGAPPTSMSHTDENLYAAMTEIAQEFQQEQLFASSAVIDAESPLDGVRASASVMAGSFFRPNILYSSSKGLEPREIQGLVDTAESHNMGVALLHEHERAALGHERSINVWIRDQSPDWHLGLRLANLDLSLLLAYQICRNWNGRIRFLTICEDEDDVRMAETYLHELIDEARLTPYGDSWVRHGRFWETLDHAPRADLNIFGLARDVDVEFLDELVERTGNSCLFVRDSGQESALA